MTRHAFAFAFVAATFLALPSASGAPVAPRPEGVSATELLDAERTFTINDSWEPLVDWLSAVASVTTLGLAVESVGREGVGGSSARWALLGARVGGTRAITRTFRRPDLARACLEHVGPVSHCVREAADRGLTLRRVRIAFNGAGAFAGLLGYGLSGSESLLLPAAASGVSVILDLFPTKSEKLARDRLGVTSVVPFAVPRPEGGGVVMLVGSF